MSSLEDCNDEGNKDKTKAEKMDDSDEAYNKKLEEMRSYLPFLEMMIEKLENSKKDNDFREKQMLKIRSLHSILFTSKRRMKLETLQKCEAVLRNLQAKLKGCCLFLQEKDYVQTAEDSTTKDRKVVTTDSRIVTLEPGRNIKIDTPGHSEVVQLESERRTVQLQDNGNMKIEKHNEVLRSASEHRTVQLKDDGTDMTINTRFQCSEHKRNIIDMKAVDNKKSDDGRQENKKTNSKRDTIRSPAATMSSILYKKDNFDMKKLDENISVDIPNDDVSNFIVMGDRFILENGKRQEWDMHEYIDASNKSPYMSRNESYQKLNKSGYIWENKKDLELSRRKLQSLIEYQNPFSDSIENNECPELSTEGLLNLNYKSRFCDYKHNILPPRYENQDSSISRFQLEEFHALSSNDESLPAVQNLIENRPIPGLQNYIPNESMNDKNKKAPGVEHDVAQEEKSVCLGMSNPNCNINVPKHVGGRSKIIKDMKPQQSLRAKLTEEISTVHKVGTSCGGALRSLINKDDKSLSTSRILSLKTGALIDLLGKNKAPCVKPSKPKLFSEKHKVQETKSNDFEKQGKTVASCSVPSCSSTSNKTASISNPSAIISNLSQEDLEKLINENVKNLPSPPPILLESVRAKIPSFNSKDVFQKQSVSNDVVKRIPALMDSSPFHNMCQPQNVYHVNTSNIGHQETDRPRSLSQEIPSSTTYILQQQGQQNVINSKNMYTMSSVNMTMHHQPLLNPVTPLNTDLQYQFSSQQQLHSMNIQHQHPLFIPHQNVVSGHQQTQNIQQPPQMYGISNTPQMHMSATSQMHTMSTTPQVHMSATSQMHTMSTTPQIHVMPPIQSPPIGIHETVPRHSLSKSGYSNQVSESWASKFDQDRRNLNTFQRRSESHHGRAEPYSWTLHGNQSNYVDKPSVQSSHGYYNTNKQANVHQSQLSGIGTETRVSCDQRSVTSLHRGLSARDPRRRSIEEMVGQPQSGNRTSSRSDQNRGRDPRLTSGKYNKDLSTKNRDPRIKTISFKAKHSLPSSKLKSRIDSGDKMKDRIVSSPLEKLYNTNFKEVTGKGYGPQRYKIPKIKRFEETAEENHDMKDKPPHRSEEKGEGSKYNDFSSRRSQKMETKQGAESRNTCKPVSFINRGKARESHEDSSVKSEEDSLSEEETKKSTSKNDNKHETKKYKRIIEYKKKYKEAVEKPTLMKKNENYKTESYLKVGGKNMSNNCKSDKQDKTNKPDLKGDSFKLSKQDTKDDKTGRPDTNDDKKAKSESKDSFKLSKQDAKDDKTGRPDTNDDKKAKSDTKDSFKLCKQDTKEDETGRPDKNDDKKAKSDTKDDEIAKPDTKDNKIAKSDPKDCITAKPDIKDDETAKLDANDDKIAKPGVKDDKTKPVTENYETAKLDTGDNKINETNTEDDKTAKLDTEIVNIPNLETEDNDFKTVKVENDEADKPSTNIVEDNFEVGKSHTKDICNKSDIIETLISNKSLEFDEKKTLLKKLEETLPDKKFKKILKIIESSSDDESNGDELKTVKMSNTSETVVKSVEDNKKSIPDECEKNRFENYRSNDESDVDENVKEIHLKKVKKYTKKKSNKSDKKPVTDTIDTKNLQEIECAEDIVGSKTVETTVNDISDRPKRKQKNELEKLQEDIRDMFISKGVVAATGMRMCRMQKESTSNSPNVKESVPILRSKQGKLESHKGVGETKNNKDKDSLPNDSSDYNTSDDEFLETVHRNLKSKTHVTNSVEEIDEKITESTNFTNEETSDTKNSEVNTGKVAENIGSPRIILKKTDLSKLGTLSSTDANSQVKNSTEQLEESSSTEKPVARYKIFKGRKKANWKLGIIHKKSKPKTQPNKCQVMGETESISAEVKDESATKIVDYLDIQYYQGKLKKYQCKLCAYEGKAIVHHYLVCHPGEEVLISRLSPESAADAVRASIHIGYHEVSKLSDKFQCRMCVRSFPSILSFYEHITMHTGEYRHECLKCRYKTSTRKGIRYHVKTSHPETRKGEMNFHIVHEVSAKEKVLVGYLCSGCNFVQLRECNIKKHIKQKHLNKEAKVIEINLSKQKPKEDQQIESEIIEDDQTFEIKEEVKKEVRTDEEADYEIDVENVDIENRCTEGVDVSVRSSVSEHETKSNDTSQNNDVVSYDISNAYTDTEKTLHSGPEDNRLNEDDSEKVWHDVVIKKEQEINIVDIDTKNSNSASITFGACDSINNESSAQNKLNTNDSDVNSTEQFERNEGNKVSKVDQTNVFLCSEDFSTYEDNVRLERQLTMEEIARSINVNDIKYRKIEILDQVLEKLNTRHKEHIEGCSANLGLVTTNEKSGVNKLPVNLQSPLKSDVSKLPVNLPSPVKNDVNKLPINLPSPVKNDINKLPVNLPSPVAVEDEVHSSDKSDNVRTRRSLPERSCKEKTLKNNEKICQNEIDSLSDSSDLSVFKEYLQASPVESELEIIDVREITASIDNTDTEEVSRKNSCLKNTVSQLTETLKTSKAREFLLDEEFSNMGELWLYKVKNLPNHSWKLVMDQIKYIIGSVGFRNACGCTSSVSLVVGPLESYCLNECWFFKCNVQNCSFTTSVAVIFAEHIECNHICTTWNGVCTLCKIIYCVENEIKPSYHLASAFLHLLKDHFLNLTNILPDEPQKKMKGCEDSSGTTLTSSDTFISLSPEMTHKIPQVNVRPLAAPILRVRRLSGDKLSVTPAEKMKKSIDESRIGGNQQECKSEQGEGAGCSFLKIENVVSLNPSANVEKVDNVLQLTEAVSSPPSSKITFVTANSAPAKIQTITPTHTVTLMSAPRPVYKSFTLPANQKLAKTIPVNQIILPQLFRPTTLRNALPSSTQFVSSQLRNYKILNVKSVDLRNSGQIIYPVVSPQLYTTINTQLPTSKISQPSVSALTQQQLQAVLQCVQQKQADQTHSKKDVRNVTESPKKLLLKTKPSLMSRDLTDEVSKFILMYKDPAAYKEMLLYKNVIHFYKCMSRDCSFSSPCGKAFLSHLEKHKAEDDSKGLPEDKRYWTKCAYCLKTFKASKEFCIHLRKEHGQSNIQCAYCFYRSAAVANVVFHQKVCHRREPLSLLKCVMSDGIPPRTKGLNIHAFVKPLVCGEGCCLFRTYLFDAFENHLKTMQKTASVIACSICKLQIVGISQLFKHLKEEHYYNNFQCLHCKFGTDSEDSIRYHLCAVHADCAPAAVARMKASRNSGHDKAEHLKRVIFIEEIDKKYIRSPPPPLQDISPDMSRLCSIKCLPTPQKSISAKSDNSIGKSSLSTGDRAIIVSDGNKIDSNVQVHGSDPLSIEADTRRRTKSHANIVFINKSSAELFNVPTTRIKAGSDVVNVKSSTGVDVRYDSCNEVTDKNSSDKNSDSVIRTHSGSKSDVTKNIDLLKRTVTRTKSYITGLKGKDLYWCAYEGCRYRGIDSTELKSHLQICERYTSVLKCAHCPKIVKTSANLMEHLRTHGPLRYMCSLCEFKDSVQSRITTHMKQVHKVSSTNPVPLNVVEKNSEHAQFVLLPKEKGAQKLIQMKKDKSKTKQEFSPNEINDIPLGSVFPKPLKCSLCKYKSKVRTNLLIHLNLHLESAAKECNVPDAEVVNPVPCLDKNEMMFDKMMNLASSSHKNTPKVPVGKTDMKKEGVEDTNNHLPQFVPETQRYSCLDCSHRTVSESMLRYHIRSLHNNQSHYRCPHCPESSSASLVSIDRLAAHMKLHDSQLYKCSHCSYHHYTRHIVERHLTEKHPEKRPFVIAVRERDPEAESSSETDTREGSVAGVQLTTEGVAKSGSKQIHCKLCKFRAGNEEDMKTHCGNVHGIKSRFKCGLCAFTSDDDSDFDAHFAENHEKLPTQIVSLYEKVEEIPVIPLSSDALCEASTSAAVIGDATPLWQRGGNKVRHIRGIFIDEEGTAQAPIATPTLEQIANKTDLEAERFPPHGYPAAGSIYVCPMCTKYKTKDPAAMKTHLYREQNYKPWLCTVCGVTTMSRIQALKHLSKQHPKEAKDTPDTYIMYCQEPDCEKWVNGVLETQLNLMVTVNDNVSIQSGDDIHKPSKVKTPPSHRKRRIVSENVGLNSESPSKPSKPKRQKTVSKMKELEASITKGRYCCGYCTLSTDHKAILKLHHQKMHSNLQESMREETSNDDVEIMELKDPLEGTSSYLESGDLSNPISLHPNTKGRKNKFTKCGYCNFTAHSMAMVKKHWRSDHKYKQYCDAGVSPGTGVKFLYKTIYFDSDELYECRWCKFNGRMSEIQQHHKLSHPERQFHVILINIPNYKCSECNAVFLSVRDISKHFTELHGKEVSHFVLDKKQDTKRSDIVVPPDKSYKCPLCVATFSSYTGALNHIHVHAVIHKCFYCDEDFMNLTDGHSHMASKHCGLESQFHVARLSDKDMQIIKESINIVGQNESDIIKTHNAKKESSCTELDLQLGQKRWALHSNDVVLPKKIKQTARKSTTPHQKRYIKSTTFWPGVAGSKSLIFDCAEEFIIPDVDASREPQTNKPLTSESQQKSSSQESLITIELSDSDENLM